MNKEKEESDIEKYWLTWHQVEKKFGKELADKMKKSDYLKGITVCTIGSITYIPPSDIERAYKDVTGKPINHLDWD